MSVKTSATHLLPRYYLQNQRVLQGFQDSHHFFFQQLADSFRSASIFKRFCDTSSKLDRLCHKVKMLQVGKTGDVIIEVVASNANVYLKCIPERLQNPKLM